MKKIIWIITFMFFAFIDCYAEELNNYDDLAQYQIVLIGENHGIAKTYDVELEIFEYLYKSQNVRDLFIESGYCATQLLNRYIKTGNLIYLNTIFANTRGTMGSSFENYNFFIKLRAKCPEVVLHGIDVEHQWESTGISYLCLLLSEQKRIEGIPYWSVPGTLDGFIEYYEHNKEKYSVLENDLEEFDRGILSVKKGKCYTTNNNQYEAEKYREETMTLNFEIEYSNLGNKKVIGIFGLAHTGLNENRTPKKKDLINVIFDLANTGLNENMFYENYPCMAKRLKEKYKNIIVSVDCVYKNCTQMNPKIWFSSGEIRNTNIRSDQNAQFYKTIQNSPATAHWSF
jgi:hypothetical protein